MGEFPGEQVFRTPLPLPEARVRSLVRELRSCKLHSVAKKKEKEEKKGGTGGGFFGPYKSEPTAFFFFFKLFIYLATSGLSCGTRDLLLWHAGLVALRHVGS